MTLLYISGSIILFFMVVMLIDKILRNRKLQAARDEY